MYPVQITQVRPNWFCTHTLVQGRHDWFCTHVSLALCMCIYHRVFQTTTIRLPSHHFPQDSLHHLSLIFQPCRINRSPPLRTWTMLQTTFSSSQRGMVTANTTLTKWSQQSGSQTPWFRWHLTAPPRVGSECSTPSLRRSGGTATSMSSSGNFMMMLMMMMMLWWW